MWIRTQDKSKIINMGHIQYITISKSYGSKDSDGKQLSSAIIFQPSQGSVISMGLYHDIYEAQEIMDKLMELLSSDTATIFQMP